MIKRRDFLKISAPLAMTPLLLNALPVRAFATPTMVSALNADDLNERVLVIIRLAGANDGINTLVPIDQYDRYVKLRPSLRLPKTGSGAYVNLDSRLSNKNAVGLHPGLLSMKAMYEEGKLNIIQGVGYPESNRSHFKSTDLWLTGGDGREEYFNLREGWIGRYLESRYPEFLKGPTPVQADPLGIQIGENTLSLGFHTEEQHAVALTLSGQNPSGFFNLINQIGGLPPSSFPNSDYGTELEYLVQIQNNTGEFAGRISEVFNQGKNMLSYPNRSLAGQLKTVARLISGGSQTKVYMVSLGGFDTHAGQAGRHADLLAHLADSVKAFYDDLKALKADHRVISVAFSEFGRKAQENANQGTDHGTLGPMFVFGPRVKSGVTGTNVNLSDLDSGGAPRVLQHDYRSVFGSLLIDWLGADAMTMRSTGFDQFTVGNKKLSLLDNQFSSDPGPSPVFSGVGEVGKLFITQSNASQWHLVRLRNRYANPVVIMGALKYEDQAPATLRVRNVTSGSFQFQIDEWNYLNGSHLGEMCHYMVVEAGVHRLANGKVLQAGIQYLVDSQWRKVSFTEKFKSTPIVFSQCASASDSSALVTRHKEVYSSSFQIRLQKEEAQANRSYSPETVNWIALEPSIYGSDNKFEAATSSIDHKWKKLTFKQSYDVDAVVLMAIQSYNGADTCSLRYKNVTANSMEVFIEEEKSRDQETNHPQETMAYMVFNYPGNLLSSSSLISSPVGRTIWIMGNNGRYVSSNNGSKSLSCDKDNIENWEKFKVIDAGNGKIALQGSNMLFVSSENGSTTLNCNRSKIGSYEKFDWIDLGNYRFALKGNNSQYVSSENGYKPLICNRGKVGDWETFNWGITSAPIPVGQVVWLKGNNQKYVSSNNGLKAMTCDRTSRAGWEQFTVVKINQNKIALKGSNNQYVSSENGLKAMNCNRSNISSTETFEWIDLGDNRVAFKATNGSYISSENGLSPMNCNRKTIGTFETFFWELVPLPEIRSTVTSSNVKSQNVSEVNQAPNWDLYPNPASDQITIKHSGEKIQSFRLIDIQGKHYEGLNANQYDYSLEIRVSHLKPGLYILQITSESGQTIQKKFWKQ
ncbi:MAG: DUF1501 domain-containing protein [Microscillaceae bacterium]|nr:DUF1501 domain-containing protein [Microscillaceae bacterium]